MRLAWRNISRTRPAPTPTNISTKSEPEMEKKGTPASPATALANNVFPVPGGPTNKTPRGNLAPSLVNLAGVFKYSTSSTSSAFSSSAPATSANFTLELSSRRARERLNSKALLFVLLTLEFILEKINKKTRAEPPTTKMVGPQASNHVVSNALLVFQICA